MTISFFFSFCFNKVITLFVLKKYSFRESLCIQRIHTDSLAQLYLIVRIAHDKHLASSPSLNRVLFLVRQNCLRMLEQEVRVSF